MTTAAAELNWRGLAAAMACVTVFAMSSTLSYPLLSLLMERAEYSSTGIGINTAMAAIGILAAAPLCPRIMAKTGVPLFLALAATVAILALLTFKLADPDWFVVWLLARFALGVSAAGMFLASEYWIVATAPAEIRGRIVAAYAITLSLGYIIGPTIITVLGTDGWPPFLAGMGLLGLALIPVALAWRDAPIVDRHGADGAIRFFWTDPSVIWAVVLFGLIEFGAMALTPIWGVKLGMPEPDAVALLIALAAGNLVFQPGIGWAADRAPARPLLLVCAGTCLVVALALPAISSVYVLILALFFVWGGMAAGLYTVALTEMGARYKGGELAAANAAIVMAYGIGALVGPPAVGVAMDLAGPNGMALAVVAASLAYCALVLARSRNS